MAAHRWFMRCAGSGNNKPRNKEKDVSTRVHYIAMLLFAASCGNANGQGSSQEAEMACTDAAEARCFKREACTNGTGIVRSYGDMDTCLLREKLSCMVSVGAPDSANTPTAQEACAAAIPDMTCADF